MSFADVVLKEGVVVVVPELTADAALSNGEAGTLEYSTTLMPASMAACVAWLNVTVIVLLPAVRLGTT